MRVYAIVGGIAAGKSTVARRLARRHGGTWVDVDRIGHRVLRLGRVRQRLLDEFGLGIVGPDGCIDRRRLGAAVFGDRARLRRLNRVVHPEIARCTRTRLAALARRGARFVLLDAALYFEFDLGCEIDAVLAVVAPLAVRRQRLRRRGGLTPRQVEARLGSQPRLADWVRRSDVRIDNGGARQELDGRIEAAWRELRRGSRSRRGRS